MKKRLIPLLLILCLAFGSCTNKPAGGNDTTDPTPGSTVTTTDSVTDPVTGPVDTPEVVLYNDIVIYENDFSGGISDLAVHGDMSVSDGKLKANGSGIGAAYLIYEFPEEYRGMDYIVEVDYLGCSNMGGLLVGAANNKSEGSKDDFNGYACTTTSTGKDTIILCMKSSEGGEAFAPSTTELPTSDIHLSAMVYKDALTFRVTSLDGKTLYHEFRYEQGDHESDVYNKFTSIVGIRQSYVDNGSFDNFKVTVLVDDVIPALTDTLSVGGNSFKSAGLTVKDGIVSGNGAMLSETALTGDYRVKISLANKNISRLYFGMDDAENGYVMELDEKEQETTLYSIKDGVYSILHKKSNLIRTGFCDVIVDVHGGIASVYYDNYFQGDKAFPQFELYLDGLDGKYGLWLDGGQAQLLTTGESCISLPLETYLNPVNPGADPDMIFHEGTYYLYVYSGNDGNEIFRVYTSPDLAHFTPRNIIFTWDPIQYSNVKGGTSWSPNVFYNESDGLFYLFFAAEPIETTARRVYYASSDSPYGPFTHDGPLKAINPNANEIDGHPFVGYDGKTYMSFSRYDKGGTIWLEEVVMKDGVVTAKPSTATRVIVPDREWDNDGALRLCEGGFVWKHDGYYYMIYATGSYARHYGEAVAISKNPLGPYEKCEVNPILNWNSVIDGPGDALIIPSPDGEELYMVYHRHNEVGKVHLRQTCIDLIEFVPDPDGGPDILTVRGPSGTPQKLPSNKYRYDVNRDGTVNMDDAMLVYEKINGSEYSGYYDVDANGSLGLGDVAAILEKIGGNGQ